MADDDDMLTYRPTLIRFLVTAPRGLRNLAPILRRTTSLAARRSLVRMTIRVAEELSVGKGQNALNKVRSDGPSTVTPTTNTQGQSAADDARLMKLAEDALSSVSENNLDGHPPRADPMRLTAADDGGPPLLSEKLTSSGSEYRPIPLIERHLSRHASSTDKERHFPGKRPGLYDIKPMKKGPLVPCKNGCCLGPATLLRITAPPRTSPRGKH